MENEGEKVRAGERSYAILTRQRDQLEKGGEGRFTPVNRVVIMASRRRKNTNPGKKGGKRPLGKALIALKSAAKELKRGELTAILGARTSPSSGDGRLN